MKLMVEISSLVMWNFDDWVKTLETAMYSVCNKTFYI